MSLRVALKVGTALGAIFLPPPLPISVDVVVDNPADLLSEIDSAIAGSVSRNIGIADGVWDDDDFDMSGRDAPQLITIVSQTGANQLPHFNIDECSGFKFVNLKWHTERRLPFLTGTPTQRKSPDPRTGVVRFLGSHDLYFLGCRATSTDLSTHDYTGRFQPLSVSGPGFIENEPVTTSGGGTGFFRIVPGSDEDSYAITDANGHHNPGGGSWASAWLGKVMTGTLSGTTCTVGETNGNNRFLSGFYGGTLQDATDNITLEGCEAYNIKWGYASGGPRSKLWFNEFHDFYTSPFDHSGDYSGLEVLGGKYYNSWAHNMDGQPSGTAGGHSSMGGLSGGDKIINGALFLGGLYDVGTVKKELSGYAASVSWVKNNDKFAYLTASIAGNVLTVTDNSGGDWKVRVGQVVANLGVQQSTKITAQLTGTANGPGTYQLSSAAPVAVPSGQILVWAPTLNFIFKNNLANTNNSIGLQITNLGGGSFVCNNTLVSTRDTRTLNPNKPSFYVGFWDAGVTCADNIMCGFSTGVTENLTMDKDALQRARNNVIAQISLTGADPVTGSGSYEELFQGIGGLTPFDGANIDNLLLMFTPKLGGRLAGTNIGATAGYDFLTHFATDRAFPALTATVANGVNTPKVAFPAGVSGTIRAGAGPTYLEFTDGKKIFILMQLKMTAPDASDIYLLRAGSTGTDLTVRRLGSGKVRMTLRGAASGASTLSVDSQFQLFADGVAHLIGFSIDVDNYRVQCFKDDVNDGLRNVTLWLGQDFRLTATDMKLFSAVSGATGAEVGLVRISNEAPDLTDPTVFAKLVAQDGKPLNYGPTGTFATGRQPELYAAGPSTSWNANGGINLNPASAFKLVPSASLVDA